LHELEPDLLFQMDADLQHDPGLLPLFVALATNGFNLVIGSRFAAGSQAPGLPFPRRSLSLLGNWMVRVVGGVPRIRDCTSGYRCIHASLLRQCDLSRLPGRGYSFLSALLQELLKRGARPVELPITFGARDYGRSKLALRDKFEFLANVLRFRFRWR
jgi:dolichol-phosphate mannosyltransferase